MIKNPSAGSPVGPGGLRSKDSEEGVVDGRSQLCAGRVYHRQVHLLLRQSQELIPFDLLEPAGLQKFNAAGHAADPVLQERNKEWKVWSRGGSAGHG